MGINTNDPSAGLHVCWAGNSPQLHITQDVANNYSRLRMNVVGSPFWEMDVSSGATPSLSFWNSTQRMAVDYNGNVTALSFTPTSDRNAKENFGPVDSRAILNKVAALPISRWNFKEDKATEHLGPMAQDFYAAFSVGPDDKHIATIDADGVALAAIQGLNQKLTEELKRRDAENTELKRELGDLKQLVNSINHKLNGGDH